MSPASGAASQHRRRGPSCPGFRSGRNSRKRGGSGIAGTPPQCAPGRLERGSIVSPDGGPVVLAAAEMPSAKPKGGIRMKPYPVKYRPVLRDHRKIRCFVCGKWVDMKQEKTCPKCGKRSITTPGRTRCGLCGSVHVDGDMVCPLCHGKQRAIAELRSVNPENLTAFAHLLHDAQPSVSLAECKRQCRNITAENPYRLSFLKKPDRMKPFLQAWNALHGIAAACLNRETSRRPVVLLHSYDCRRDVEYARLLFKMIKQTERAALNFGETVELLHGINHGEKPFRLIFTSDFDHIDAWVAAWRELGGTATRSGEHL